MKPGRRIANPAAKSLAGTFRADRHANIAPIITVATTNPVAPAYLTPAAKAIWDEDLPRVVACGITEADSSLFARYCIMEAAFRSMVADGDIPKAALATELRRCSELLGIAGLRSRLAKLPTSETAKANPFTVRKS